MRGETKRAVAVLAVAPAFLVVAGLAGVGGAWLAISVMPRFENFIIMPILWLVFSLVGFVAGGAIGLALLVLLTLPVARRLGWWRQPRDV